MDEKQPIIKNISKLSYYIRVIFCFIVYELFKNMQDIIQGDI
jgi:hypothetical protein